MSHEGRDDAARQPSFVGHGTGPRPSMASREARRLGSGPEIRRVEARGISGTAEVEAPLNSRTTRTEAPNRPLRSAAGPFTNGSAWSDRVEATRLSQSAGRCPARSAALPALARVRPSSPMFHVKHRRRTASPQAHGAACSRRASAGVAAGDRSDGGWTVHRHRPTHSHSLPSNGRGALPTPTRTPCTHHQQVS